MTTAPASTPPAWPQHRLTASANATDSALMTRIARGDTAAFDELYRRHNRRVLMQARQLCASRELAEEVAQEVFISLWRGAHAYRPGAGSVGGWLSSMVRNRAIDAWRRAAARPVEVEMFEDGGARQLRAPVAAEPAQPDRSLVLSLIGDLPAAQKEAVFLAYFGDMTHAEIATHAGAPLGTIKGRIRLGLERLRPGLEEQARESPTRLAAARPALRIVPPPAPPETALPAADALAAPHPAARRCAA